MFLSLAWLTHHHDRMLLSMSAIRDKPAQERRAVESKASFAPNRLALSIVRDRVETLEHLPETWEPKE